MKAILCDIHLLSDIVYCDAHAFYGIEWMNVYPSKIQEMRLEQKATMVAWEMHEALLSKKIKDWAAETCAHSKAKHLRELQSDKIKKGEHLR